MILATFWGTAGSVGAWAGLFLWLLLSFASCLVILIALPGGWIALGLAVLYDLLHGFDAIGWPWLLTFAALLGVGEAIEAALGSLYVARKGATRYGVVGAFVGGLVGAVAGSSAFPVVGTVIGGFVGTFAGAVAGEVVRDQRVEPSIRIGLHATVGRLLSVLTKSALAAAGLALVAVAAVRSLQGG